MKNKTANTVKHFIGPIAHKSSSTDRSNGNKRSSRSRSRSSSHHNDVNIDIDHKDLTNVPRRELKNEPSISLLPGMRVHAFSIGTEGELQTYNAEQALAENQQTDHAGLWIDVDADERDQEELAEWLERLHLPKFLTSRLAEPVHVWTSHVIAQRTSAMAIIRILPWDEESNQVQYLAALKSKGLLLTFTSCPKRVRGGICQDSIAYMTEPECIPAGSASGALIAWLTFHVERTASLMRKIRSDVAKLNKMLDDDPSSVSFEDVKTAKDRLLKSLSVAEEQEECLSRLVKAEENTSALDFSKMRGSLGVLVSTAESTERTGLRIEKRIADMRQALESTQQDRINSRLNVLTVLSAIFLPLTLIAGLYGMNFTNMPELQRENAYFWVLGLMGGLAVSMFCFFYRAGWLQN
mmetsp:Transcript_4809/g.7115  ORF Transcript_4809/g.7115 Transcript_4809/m.7115 type:complete len:409 (-) Transcript_4809:1972-3198(-)